MLQKPVSRVACLVLAAAVVAMAFAPAADANPITQQFSVDVTSGPLAGKIVNGGFSYDSSSIVAGGYNQAAGLLTALDFTFNGTIYNATTANTGWLGFNSAGNLNSFAIGNDCTNIPGSQAGSSGCQVASDADEFAVTYFLGDGTGPFLYTLPGSDSAFSGNVTLGPVGVPEPGTLGLFCFGLLVLLLGTTSRWRWAVKRSE